jgi:hypothetical protein
MFGSWRIWSSYSHCGTFLPIWFTVVSQIVEDTETSFPQHAPNITYSYTHGRHRDVFRNELSLQTGGEARDVATLGNCLVHEDGWTAVLWTVRKLPSTERHIPEELNNQKRTMVTSNLAWISLVPRVLANAIFLLLITKTICNMTFYFRIKQEVSLHISHILCSAYFTRSRIYTSN